MDDNKVPPIERVAYIHNLGANILKGVTITYGETTLAKYNHCDICKGFHEVSGPHDANYYTIIQ